MPHNGSLGLLVRKDTALITGGFDNKFYPCSDYVFFAKLALFYKVFSISNVLATYRIGENLSATPEVVYGGVEFNKIVQTELVPFINIKKNILDRYIIKFAIKSISGQRTDDFSETTKGKYLTNNKLELVIAIAEYYIIKIWLVVLSKIYGRALRLKN